MEVVTKDGCRLCFRNNQQRPHLHLCISMHPTGTFCVSFLSITACEFGWLKYRKFLVPPHSTFTSSHSLTHKVWRYQPITSNGNKRSVLNYSFGMSNNACRLLFRVGETHWIIQGAGFSFFGGSDVCENLISMQEPSVILSLTLAVTAAAAWVAQKVAGTRVLPVSAGHLHTASVSRKDYRELAAPRPSSPSVCLHHVPRYAGPVPTY